MMKKIIFPIFLILILSFSLLIGGCKEKECELNSDCPSKGQCFSVSCNDNMCDSSPVLNCCGNMMCESEENACSCPNDCASTPCEGKIIVGKDYYGKDLESEYLQKMCIDDECVVSIDRSKQQVIPLTSQLYIGTTKLSVKTVVKKPLDIDEDKIGFEIRLIDADNSFIYPLKINEIQISSSGILYGSNTINGELNSVGDSFSVDVPITFTPEEAEEQVTFTIKFFYEYQQEYGGKTSTVRSESTITLPQPVNLVNPSGAQE